MEPSWVVKFIFQYVIISDHYRMKKPWQVFETCHGFGSIGCPARYGWTPDRVLNHQEGMGKDLAIPDDERIHSAFDKRFCLPNHIDDLPLDILAKDRKRFGEARR